MGDVTKLPVSTPVVPKFIHPHSPVIPSIIPWCNTQSIGTRKTSGEGRCLLLSLAGAPFGLWKDSASLISDLNQVTVKAAGTDYMLREKNNQTIQLEALKLQNDTKPSDP